MSTTAPKQTDADKADADKAKAEAEATASKAWADLVAKATAGDSSGAKQVARAIDLERQRANVLEKIAANRTYLRLMDQNEELNEAQAEFLDTFYPEKERGERRSDDELTATRRAHEHARKNGKN